jgi:AraC-like DNA-binding protein
MAGSLRLCPDLRIETVSCGLFISSGEGEHPDRVLDNYELIVVRNGTLSLWEENARFDVPPGHALLLQPGRRHRAATPFGRTLSFYWVHFVVPSGPSSEGSLEVPKFIRIQRPDCVAELFHRYLDDQEARRLDPRYASLLLLQILCEVARQPTDTADAHGNVLMGRAEAFLTLHLAEKMSTARIARALRINPDYLNRMCRRVHGMTMTEYIHRRRLVDAAALLRDNADAIAEVAAACGYRSAAHFRRVFARYRGVSPDAYRRLMARAFTNAR